MFPFFVNPCIQGPVPGEIRTLDIRLIRPTLYPAELQELWFYFIEEYSQSARTTK